MVTKQFRMEFQYETLQTCSQTTGLVVVIDVIRAFTTAAFLTVEDSQSRHGVTAGSSIHKIFVFV